MRLLYIFLFAIIPLLAFSDETPSSLIDQITALLHQHRIPGASIAVVQKGKLLWAEAFGYADLSTKQPVQSNTLFQACSITKSLTSTAVLQILEKYQIPIDSQVNDYLKRWKIPENRFTQNHPITIRMLLNHTVAISNPYPDGGYPFDAKLPTLIELFQGKPPATNPPLEITGIPGKKYAYSNGCYAILQMFLEDVTGETYPALMKKQILAPLHMDNSQFNNQLFLQSPNKIALPYDSNLKRFTKAPTISPIYATGWLWTTSTDLAKFLIAIQSSLIGSREEGILEYENFRASTDMAKSQHLYGTPVNKQDFLPQSLALQLVTPSSTPTRGLGFYISDRNGKEKKNGRYFMHSGNNIGYLTLLIGSIDGENGAIFMINISPEWNAKEYPQFDFIADSLKLIANFYHWE